MNLVLSSTPPKALALTSLALLFTSLATTLNAKDYENYSLPGAQRSAPQPGAISYLSPKIQLRGKTRLQDPSFNAQQYVFAKEAYIAEKRDEAIKLLRQEMDSGLKRNRDQLLMRLGQLYAEKYMELSYRENELHSQRLAEYEKQKVTNKSLKAPAIDNSRSKTYLNQALQLFTSLEREYPQHPKIDEILFFIGFVETEYGKTDKGVRYLERVARQYPGSKKFEEAVVFLGDYYFEKVKFRDALLKYKVLLHRKNAALYHYALYKTAWCELNSNEQRKGLEDMKSLIAGLAGTQEVAKFNLREQALKDLVVFYGEVGDVDGAMTYFTEMQGKDKAIENLKLIADILKSKARDDAAIKAYTRLLEEFPDSIETPGLYLGLYESLSRLGKTKEAVATLVRAVENYGPNSEWAKKFPAEKQPQVKTAVDALGSEAQKVAFFFHHSAQKSSNKVSYSYALQLYAALLKNFPQHPERKKIAFYRGEILYTQGQWLEAADSYMVAAQTPPKDKIADESAYAALLALDRLTAKNDKLERYSEKEQKNVSLTPEPIPANEKRFIEVAEFYLREYPQGQRIVDVRFRIAAIYYRYHHFDKSQELFKEIAMKHPKHRSATTAAHIVLDIYNLKKDYVSLDATAQMFANTPGLGDATFKKEMAQISGEIGFKKIESLEANNKWKDAGDTYYDFYKNNPTGPLAEKSLYNAFVSYEKANDTVMAAETSRLFIAKYPKSQYTQRFTLNLAKLAEKQFDFEQAQRLYNEYYKKFPKDKEARKALYNAAVFAELLERNSEALSLYEEYSRGPVTADEKRAIQISQAKLYRKSGQWDKVTQIYRRMMRESKSKEEKLNLLGELARIYEKGGRMTDRNNVVTELRYLYDSAKVTKSSGPALAYVAEAKFKAIAKQRENYEKIELKFPEQDLLYLMKRKQKALTKLAASYDSVVEVGVPDWGVASILEKADAYNNYVLNFRNLKIPAKYKGDERVEVEKALKQIDEKSIKPLEAKVTEFLNACVSKAAEFYVANEYSRKCGDRLKKTTTNAVEPTGIMPQPNYWTTRWTGAGVAKP